MDYRCMESPLGRLLLAGERGRLHCIGLPDGKGRAARAVGAANGRNPLPIVILCHRVIGKMERAPNACPST